jgi:PAS domain S-box-containing protein
MNKPESANLKPFVSSLTDDGRYRLLVEAVTDYAIYMLDPTGIVASWNAGAQRFKGYEEKEIIGHHFSEFYTEEDRASGRPAQALATATDEGRFEGQGWRIRKDGTRFWAHAVIDAIRDPSGKLVGFAKITRDLTERRAAEETLRQSEEQFRLLVQSLIDYSLYMLTPDGKVGSWNAGAERIKGYAPNEIIGQHFSRFYTEEDREKGMPQIALETAAREGRFEKEGWRVRKDGTRFWANVVIDAIRDPSGALLGFGKITRDITERRENALALERTREALYQSQKMEAVGQLTGGIAHDFNNLLTAILGSLELARKRVASDPVASRLIDNAVRGAQRGAALTQRMLAFSRRQELKLEPTDIPALVRGMSELLERSLGPSVMIETRFPLGLDRVMIDASQLEMALLNLSVNARDAMPEGGVIILAAHPLRIIAAEGGLAPGSYICLSLSDNGEGMDDATVAHAIEPFFTTKGVGKGTGLGLSMVHGFAEQSGGRLTLKSRKGTGTTVELCLPIARKAPPSPAVGAGDQLPKKALAPPHRPLKVLVVDDDSLVLINLAAMMEDLGHSVIEANSAQEALNALRTETGIDLVVTDQAMPRMTGLQLIAEIEANWPEVPTILASGYADLTTKIDPTQSRLTKPFLQYDLEQAVEGAMRRDADRRVVKFSSPP